MGDVMCRWLAMTELSTELSLVSMRLRYHLKPLLWVSLIMFSLVYFNDLVCRPMFPKYNLRLLDHLYAAIYIPYVIRCITAKLTYGTFIYFAWCTEWEVSQAIGRGYFQFDQYTVDLFGILLIFGLIAYKKHRWVINIDRRRQNFVSRL